MEESEIKIPLYYVMGREADQQTLAASNAVFTITPCIGVVSNDSDKDLIQDTISENYFLKAADETACEELSAHVSRVHRKAVLTVGAGKALTAVYPDGEREEICLSRLIETN